jgi:hypothetical protein
VLVAGGEVTCGFECHSPLSSAELYDPSTGSWTATGDMIEAHTFHTAALLPDGKVLVAGGCCGSGYLEPIASAELFDPKEGTWTATGEMIEAGGTTATLLPDGRVLVAGTGGGQISAELYDPGSGTWTATGNMAEAPAGETATLMADGKVLLVAGSNGGHSASAQMYDPSGGS